MSNQPGTFNEKMYRLLMDSDKRLTTITEENIDWVSLKGLPEEAIERERSLSFHYPSFIYGFRKSATEVCWQLNPDERYFMTRMAMA